MASTRLTFLGTASAVPEPGRDTASFLINGRVQVDCGWQGGSRLLAMGVCPDEIDWLVFTHCHHDHYLGLASLLFWRLMRGRSQAPLRIAGPEGEVERAVDLSWRLLQPQRFFPSARAPEVLALRAGQAFDLAVADLDPAMAATAAHPGGFTLRARTCASLHAVPGLAYRFEAPATGADFVLAGDTAFHPPVAELARGAQVLVHEASLGGSDPPPGGNAALHSSAREAARIAASAGVRRLYLVHMEAGARPEALAAAREVFAESHCPGDGDTLALPLAPAGPC